MADGPAWSSSTSYYAGRRDADRDDGARVHSGGSPYGGGHAGSAAYPPAGGPAPGYEPGYNAGYPAGPGYPAPAEGWTPPTHSTLNGANGAVGANDALPRPTRASRAQERQATRQRGWPAWAALLLLLAISGVGGLVDTVSGSNIRGGFNIALVIASLAAILIVRHRDMFPIVVAPPLVYIVASGVVLYVRSGGLHNRKILIDAAANWLVYGFPAIAGASAAVLIVAGIRLVIRK